MNEVLKSMKTTDLPIASNALGPAPPETAACGKADSKNRNLCVEYPPAPAGCGDETGGERLDSSVCAGRSVRLPRPERRGQDDHDERAAGVHPRDQRRRFLFGTTVREPIARQRIGYLPELTYYYKFLSAEELLRFYARIFKIPRAGARTGALTRC